jgi:tetratricopeptide (TPR) repeat protein
MKNLMIEAFELKRNGYYKQAIEVYYKLLSETDDNIEILVELADLYFLMNNNDKSVHYINKVLEINPDYVPSLEILKKVYISEHDFDSAIKVGIKIYEKEGSSSSKYELLSLLYKCNKYGEICAFNVNDTEQDCLFLQAKSLYRLKGYERAKNILEKMTLDEHVMLLLGKVYYRMGMLDKTKEVYRKLKDLDLKDSESLYFVGLNYLEELELDKAIECFKEAIALRDGEAKYYYHLGQSYFLKGWIEEAQKSFNSAICLNPTVEDYHYSLAYLLYRIGDYENALIHLDDSNLNSKILALVIKAEQGNLATPKIELEKMLKESPDNELILFSLAKIYYKLDMFKQSETIMSDVLAINDKSFEYQEFYVKLLLKLGKLEKAKNIIELLINKYPRYYYAKVLEAELNYLLKDYDSLFDVAQELIELDLNHFEGYYYNALALFEKDDIDFAIESLKKAITLDVNNAELYVKMAEFYQTIGKYEDAFEYVKEASDIDKSAKNQELYLQLSKILHRRNSEA